MTESTSASRENTDYVGDPVLGGEDNLSGTPMPDENPHDERDVREGREPDPNLSDLPADEQPHPGGNPMP